MKKGKLTIFLGILITLVFFYLGFKEWMKSKEEKVQPPPVVVRPAQPESRLIETPPPPPPVQEQPQVQPEQTPPQKDQNQIAQKIREETEEEKREEKKKKPEEKDKKTAKAPERTYTVQVGAFVNKEGAERVASRARKMGYKVTIVEEDNFYKVRLLVTTCDIQSELTKLRSIFGGAILK